MKEGELRQPLISGGCEAFEVDRKRQVWSRYHVISSIFHGWVSLSESKEEVDTV